MIANTLYISSWKSKGLSAETSKPPSTSDNSLTLLIDYVGNKIRLKFSGSCLKQPKPEYTQGAIVNIYIVCELGVPGSNNNYPTLQNCLFGAVSLTKNADIDKYRYSGYGIGLWKIKVFISGWWIWSKHINFWSRHDFFYSCK